MKNWKPLRMPGERAMCRDCGAEFEAGRFAKYCPVCRPLRRRSKRTKYVLDGETIALLRGRYDGRVRGRAEEIARRLGWPKWAVTHAAVKLGLAAHDRKTWTPNDVEFVRLWAGLRSAAWIARRLGRTENAVGLKINRLRLSRLVANGYSAREVCRCFGVDHRSVERWIERGYLRQGICEEGRPPRSRENDLRNFVRNHPLAFRLDKVDQVWFLGLVLGLPGFDEARTPPLETEK